MKLNRTFITAIALWIALATAGSFHAQPTPREAALIDAVMEMLESSSDEALSTFIDKHYADGVPNPSTIEQLRELRTAARGKLDDLGIDKTPGGFVFSLGSGDPVRLAVEVTGSDPMKIRKISRLASEPAPSDSESAALRAHIRAIETLHQLDPDEALQKLEADHFAPDYLRDTTHASRLEMIHQIREITAQAGGVVIRQDEAGVHVELMGRTSATITFSTEPAAPWRITTISLEERSATALEWESLEVRLDRAAEEGLSGVVYAVRDGKPFLRKAYGYADRDTGRAPRFDTIFGIGSTPIDFTVTGIHLLHQRDALGLDDPITKYFDAVPADKRSMTIRHLLSGKSGLPDFHEVPGVDWDYDLAWIDRDTAVKRILGQELLFAPGESRAHSHSAFGLLAAIIELVSGRTYQEFVRAEMLEPAGMKRTGFYGEVPEGLTLEDFAIGYGESSVGLPNIPPNWGPTSWLVMGSGGMFSTLEDMHAFYRTVAAGKILKGEHLEAVSGPVAAVGGSQRGFFILYASSGIDDEILMLTNNEGRSPMMRALTRELMDLIMREER